MIKHNFFQQNCILKCSLLKWRLYFEAILSIMFWHCLGIIRSLNWLFYDIFSNSTAERFFFFVHWQIRSRYHQLIFHFGCNPFFSVTQRLRFLSLSKKNVFVAFQVFNETILVLHWIFYWPPVVIVGTGRSPKLALWALECRLPTKSTLTCTIPPNWENPGSRLTRGSPRLQGPSSLVCQWKRPASSTTPNTSVKIHEWDTRLKETLR